jgi:SAM-dependent methyltransferase
VHFALGILPDVSLPSSAYDLVFSNSLLHHLHRPDVLWQAIRRSSRAGTQLFVMDLMRPQSRETAAGLVERYAANEPAVLQRDFYNSLLAAFTVDEVRSQLEGASLADLPVEAVSDRHLIVWGAVKASAEAAAR